MTNQWDAVYAVDLDTLPSALLAARLKGKPCFFDAHEWFSETPEVERRPWIRRFWKLVGQATAKHADAAFTVGPSLARELSREYGCSFEVVRNVPVGRSLPTTHEPSDPSRPILLYQGMLNEGRGLESVILALKTLPEASLWIAGEGDRSEQLRQLVSRERLDRQVQFLGLLHPEALYQVTMKATLGLNLLESRSKSYYYSLANKAFDYLQAGIPAIHMNFPEYEALNHPLPVAYLIADLQPKTISACIRQLINQPDSYHQIRENCLKMAPSIRWEEEFKTIEKIIDNVLTKRG